MGATLRRLWRLPQLVMLLFGGLFWVSIVFPVMGQRGRDRAIAVWSRMLVRACGLRVTVIEPAGQSGQGASPEAGSEAGPALDRQGGRLLVANHVSWVDVFVIHALAPSSFIAKDDIARWPLVGTLCGRAGTLFLARGRPHAVHRALADIAELMKAGRRVAIFPEGTAGVGDVLLPFHSNLVQAAVQAGVPVDPVGLRYRGLNGEWLGEPDGTMFFVGEITFVESLWRIIGAPGVLAEVHVCQSLEPIDPSGARARHLLARQSRAEIAQALEIPLDDELPEMVRNLRARSNK